MSIESLNADSIDRICASQVIPNVSSAIRELVENAIDAQASSISVRVRNQADEIEVADSGSGIAECDWSMMCTPHATSKISSFHDITSAELNTHGFRGEALSALSTLAKTVRILTRTHAMEAGRVLEFSDGKQTASGEVVSKSIGTTVIVIGLYRESLPVRYHEMLSGLKRELKVVHRMIVEVAILHPSIKFELLVDGKCNVSSPGGSDCHDVYKKLVAGADLVKVLCSNADPVFTLSGWITTPLPTPLSKQGFSTSTVSKSESGQFLFLNKRPINIPKKLLKAISAVYTKFAIQRVNFILFLEAKNADLFECNASVDKRSVIFEPVFEDQVVEVITNWLNDQFQSSRRTPPETTDQLKFRSSNMPPSTASKSDAIPTPADTPVSKIHYRKYVNTPPTAILSATHIFMSSPSHDGDRKRKLADQHDDSAEGPVVDEADTHIHDQCCSDEIDKDPSIPFQLHKEQFRDMELIGQFNNGFIIARLEEPAPQLFLIDQHAAHEKYLFEQYYKNIKIAYQSLVSPIVLKVAPSTESFITEKLADLSESGFQIECRSENAPGSRLLLKSLPTLSGIGFNRSASLTVADLMEIIAHLESAGETTHGQLSLLKCLKSVRSMFASKACRTAVMVGDALSRDRMMEIVRNLSHLEQPWNCPHGRPTVKHLLSVEDLSQYS